MQVTKILKRIDQKKILFIALLFAVFFLTYSPHFKNHFPFHFDEWTHLSRAEMIKEQGISYFFKQSPVEIGFDLILLAISFFTNAIMIYQFLPALNAVIVSIVLFYFISRKFNYWTGIASVVLFASLRSNVNLLGLWFFVPVTAVIALDYACLFTLEDSVKKDKPKKLFLVALYLLIIAFIHQSSFIVISLVIFIYLCFNYKFVIKNWKYFAPLLILLIPAAIMAIYFGGFSGIIENLIWNKVITHFDFNPFFHYGMLASIFAAIGYIICTKKKELLSFRIYVLFALINIAIFYIGRWTLNTPYNFTLFSAYQRYIYHFMIAAVPLSAVGFYSFVKNVKDNVNEKNAITALLIAASLTAIFFNYYTVDSRAQLYYSIYPDEYEALQSLRGYPEGNLFTLVRLGATVKAISGQKPVLDFRSENMVGDVAVFYTADCSIKKRLIETAYFSDEYVSFSDKGVNYVHSKNQMNCTFLKELYNKNGNYIYLVEKINQ